MDERKLLPLLILFLTRWQETVAVVPVRHVAVDVGRDLQLECADESVLSHPEDSNARVMWIREGREDGQIERLKVEPNGMLELLNVSVDDAGNYSCTLDDDRDAVKARINVEVRTPPPALHNVWVKPSTILANILWEVAGTGGYPIIDFTAEYRLKPAAGEEPEEWKPIIPTHIPPNSRQIDVYHLVPNTTYSFRVWATNQLGRGEIVEVEGHTHHSVEELELARHLLAGVENFDTRVWVAAVGIVMGTLMILGLGTCYLLYRECKAPSQLEEQEVIELVPNIILNPGFFDERTEHVPQDENFNNQTTTRLNNNNVVQPRRL
ncbi:Down syndrome cell adhesion molecule-like protein 1 [Camponotus floridanus]|uniref:Down syndrome cell adhesion molecule-like protein 1 n=1 Tax=Camponotus floridanus TaxID=104421 RepID=E1ZVC3_CAMFO|nr:contactin-2 isoform X1 [Camponotus floridanus]EFN74833.1 Down syndrome cell adhesion molecule-like protein 1 [Camponotus floridanus]